jgi:TrmH family RNA methyltransferase
MHRAVILVRPHFASNLGSVARAAKNFGVRDVRLIEPAVLPDEESARLASGADDLLAVLTRYERLSDAVGEFDAVVATSSLRGREEQRFLDLHELPGFLTDLGSEARVAFVFGPERSGLTEDERSRASACLRLPTDPAFPTMNISHAVAVVLAVATLADAPGDSSAEAASAEAEGGWSPAADIEGAIGHWDRALEAIGFYDTGHRDRSLRDWRSLVAPRPLTRREVAILRGVANRILVSLRRAGKES